MIIINTPHNTSGSNPRESDLKELEDIALQHNILVLSDQSYERLIFDSPPKRIAISRSHREALLYFLLEKPFMRQDGKWGTSSPGLFNQEIRKTHQFIVFSVNTPIQLALAEYMKIPAHYESLGAFYQKKRDFFLEQMKGSVL